MPKFNYFLDYVDSPIAAALNAMGWLTPNKDAFSDLYQAQIVAAHLDELKFISYDPTPQPSVLLDKPDIGFDPTPDPGGFDDPTPTPMIGWELEL